MRTAVQVVIMIPMISNLKM